MFQCPWKSPCTRHSFVSLQISVFFIPQNSQQSLVLLQHMYVLKQKNKHWNEPLQRQVRQLQ